MKAVIFLSALARYINLYDFKTLVKNHTTISIIGHGQLEELKDSAVCFFDKIIQIPKNDIEGEPNSSLSISDINPIIDEIKKRNSIERIICVDEGNVLLAAKIRQTHKVSGPNPDKVEPFTNKAKMHNKLAGMKITQPKFISIKQIDLMPEKVKQTYSDIEKTIGTPFVLKPKSSSGGFGLRIIQSKNDLLNMTPLPEELEYMASEYISGNLFHCDIQVIDKKIAFFGMGEYLNPLHTFMKGHNSGSILLQEHDPKIRSARSVCEKILLDALNIESGSFHIELFCKESDWVFLEAGYRPPGGRLIPLYEKNLGINLYNSDYLINLGMELSYSRNDNHCFLIITPEKAGKMLQKTAPTLSTRIEIEWLVKNGELMKEPRSITDKALVAFGFNTNYESLYHDFLSLRDYSFFEST